MTPDRERIGHYRIVRRIGSGGMGDVYLADDERLPRQVALKVISSQATFDETSRRRFLREAQAVSALSHAGIAHIYEIGADEEMDYIAMELVDGDTLAHRISGEPMSIEEVLDIAVQLADAVAEAHDHGVVHRDIKPSNVMLTRRARVKVLDFGLAKIDPAIVLGKSSKDETDEAPATMPGVIVGTANYMSPEQALGDPVDRRGDVFSLGVVLYELIAGRLPFAGKNMADTLHRITSVEPEPLARFNYELPVELERIVRKCLEKAPGRRYPSARELHTDLEALQRARTSAPQAPWLDRARTRSHRMYWPLAAVVAIAMIAAAISFLRDRRPPTAVASNAPIRAVAILPFTNESVAGENDYISEGLTNAAINRLAEDRNLRVMARSTVFRFRESPLLPQQIGQQLKVDAVVTGSVTLRGGALRLVAELVSVKDGSRLWGQEFDGRTSDLISVENDLVKGLSEALRSPRAPRALEAPDASRAEAHNWYLRGQFAFHARQLNEAMAAFEKAIEKDPTYAPPHAGRADVASVMERYGDVPASRTAPIALAASAKALELDPNLPEAHVALASVHDTYDWNWTAAESEYQKAIALRPADALAHQWYALLLSRLGRHDEALREITTAQALDPFSAAVHTAAANILYYARRPDDAMTHCAKAISLDGSFDLARVQLGMIIDQQGRFGDAAQSLESFGEPPRASNVGAAALAITEVHAGNRARARELLRELEARAPGQSIEYYAAGVHAALGDRDAAFRWLERAHTAHSAWLGRAKVDPAMDPLREDPRFDELLKRVNLR